MKGPALAGWLWLAGEAQARSRAGRTPRAGGRLGSAPSSATSPCVALGRGPPLNISPVKWANSSVPWAAHEWSGPAAVGDRCPPPLPGRWPKGLSLPPACPGALQDPAVPWRASRPLLLPLPFGEPRAEGSCWQLSCAVMRLAQPLACRPQFPWADAPWDSASRVACSHPGPQRLRWAFLREAGEPRVPTRWAVHPRVPRGQASGGQALSAVSFLWPSLEAVCGSGIGAPPSQSAPLLSEPLIGPLSRTKIWTLWNVPAASRE